MIRDDMPECCKKKFDKKGAQTVRNDLKRMGREVCWIYQCWTCDMWHLTKEEVHFDNHGNRVFNE